jgi:hypothetical protein
MIGVYLESEEEGPETDKLSRSVPPHKSSIEIDE